MCYSQLLLISADGEAPAVKRGKRQFRLGNLDSANLNLQFPAYWYNSKTGFTSFSKRNGERSKIPLHINNFKQLEKVL